jgi:beta-galactosidase
MAIGNSTLLPNPNAVTPTALQSANGTLSAVPGLWTMQGFEKPHYLNIKMPFPNTPPSVPDANPVGVYHRQMTIPTHWQHRRVILHFGGVEGMLCVYVDGHAIGMGNRCAHPRRIRHHSLCDCRSNPRSNGWW